MAQRGYLGIHAEVPTAQYLRSAIVVNGAQDQDQDQSQKRSSLVAGLFWAVLHPYNAVGLGRGAKLARDGGGSATHMLSVPSLCFALLCFALLLTLI
ncbi:hypothetical protein [Pseudomonas sp. P97.38]|uniref:hypothetical protein n=1 Tax=Pseudomonas sp. P97.38 TaxID=255451 RepID=UPI0009F99B76|nr:hypothetical protein [Pseudomonas sp. P97.38]